MAEKTVPTTAPNKMTQNKERTRMQERYLQPPVDIYETEEGLVVLADLPGVSANDLKIRLEDNILTIQGNAQHLVEAEPIYREFQLYNFFRQFELSDQVDQERISASLNHGVLRLYLARAERTKPREIPVQIDPSSGQKVAA
jgi:HSP20 family molecular chaperone IbpA